MSDTLTTSLSQSPKRLQAAAFENSVWKTVLWRHFVSLEKKQTALFIIQLVYGKALLTGCRKLQKGMERLVKFFNESYSSHSPDLAPSDYFLFPKLKEHFSGRWFSSDSAVKTSAETWLNGYGPDFYQDGLKKLVLHSDNS
ncbi:uncharacterized protein TNCV_2497081 [Trichonephila clavipes]|nr:uncharacterized protein TNCV_2497081 [Trichonephila clavipes]